MASTSSAADLAAELEQLLQYASDVYVSNLCTVAAAVWLSYDILAALPNEASYVWNCQGWLWYDSYNGALITVLLGEAMFLMRLYAAYTRSKLLLVIIALLYTAELAIGVATATAVATSVVAIERPSSFPIPGCLLTPPKYPRLSIAAWSVAMCASCIHFLLILHKFAGAISLTRQSTPLNRVSIWELGSISPLMWSLVRDSAVYFFLVFAVNLVYLLFGVMFQRRALTVMSTSWLAAVYSISALRLCLNTRESLQRQTSEDDTFEDVLNISNQFIAPPRGTNPGYVQFRATSTSRNTPTIVSSQSDVKFSLQHPTFDSGGREDGLCLSLPPVARSKTRTSAALIEDYEPIPVSPWTSHEHAHSGEAIRHVLLAAY
ncbi:hypothetical protein DICSQDRAFT_169898 [Dichomitus squalens LYAD-421 SS1]|uniref:Transmembrane protein n=1 Tax=Dichomitus squalens (strain LYAD-421) TaxID=732165 RepID=R7T0K1_DICSQ|nr:uncharacterized protein DICSQDRAFT_169898 [Dichomitus squalens LYAD-421 SS1]EJF61881.1 hypothetical protein DICSQDRAFT_169898 [Dichomitus squalens LYAD-421 SS1]